MTAKGIPMDGLAESLEEAVEDFGGRTIVNKTGLDGPYDFTLKWLPQRTADAPGVDSAAGVFNLYGAGGAVRVEAGPSEGDGRGGDDRQHRAAFGELVATENTERLSGEKRVYQD